MTSLLTPRCESDSCFDSYLHRSSVDGAETGESDERQHDGSTRPRCCRARDAATDEPGVPRLGHDGHIMLSTDPNDRGDLFDGVGPHDSAARALVSPGPVDLVSGAHIVIDEHMGRTNRNGQFLDHVNWGRGLHRHTLPRTAVSVGSDRSGTFALGVPGWNVLPSTCSLD